MTLDEKAAEWVRYWKACLSPDSRLGALRGAYRDRCLTEMFKMLKIVTPADLFEEIHQDELKWESEREQNSAYR